MDNVERQWDVSMFIPSGLVTTVTAKTEREAIEAAKNLHMDAFTAHDDDEITYYATALERF